eukprot:10380205-Prorocentrum_lima.AAC.1
MPSRTSLSGQAQQVADSAAEEAWQHRRRLCCLLTPFSSTATALLEVLFAAIENVEMDHAEVSSEADTPKESPIEAAKSPAIGTRG